MFALNTHNLEQSTWQARTPDQLLPYVHAVSTVTSYILGDYTVHMNGSHAILVGYSFSGVDKPSLLDEAVAHLLSLEIVEHITVLAPTRSRFTPEHATVTKDAYYILNLPLSLSQQKNVASMCHRAQKHISIQITEGGKQEQHTEKKQLWTGEHQELLLQYIRRPQINAAMGSIFQCLERYCRQPQHVCLFSAYDNTSGALQGFTVGDFNSWHMAFYMFALRLPTAVPGVAETLLYSLLQEAQNRGYSQCNLGLGINAGIRFFKEKWGAKPHLPLVQCSWEKHAIQEPSSAKSWWARMLGGL